MNTSEIIKDVSLGWRALDRVPEGKELQSISIDFNHAVEVRSGRLAENAAEIVLFGFELEHYPKPFSLPSGAGFDVKVFQITGKKYVGVSRTAEGALDLFESMLSDLLLHVFTSETLPHKVLFRRFMNRVHAWQAFMGRGKKGLSRQEELGLMGELIILEKLLNLNIPSEEVVGWWQGPFHGVQDFQMLGSAIEVKASVSEQGFEIKVFDLEQLDPSGLQELHLAAVRLKPTDSGITLPRMIQAVKEILQETPNALDNFEIALVSAGYQVEHDAFYSLAVELDEIMYFNVDRTFPSLRRASIPVEVIKVRYSIELDLLPKPQRTLEDILTEIGVVGNGTD